MKKKLLLLITLTALASAVLSSGAYAAANGLEQYIGDAKAKSIALENAGVKEDQAIFIKAHLDYDDGYVVYDVEFYSGDTEYDYEINAVNGEIREYDKDIEYYRIPAASSAGNAQEYIGEEKAKSAALENAGVTAEQATFIKAYLDYDDGRVVYDVEFYTENTEYDYEIDAVSGEIVEYDYEIEYRAALNRQAAVNNAAVQTAARTDRYIGEEKAKTIALANAGLTESQVRKMDIDLDREHGVMVYEIEFDSGQKEYEYEINAADGTLLKSNVEYDD